MLSVVLLGTGNVAQHLFQALKKADSVLVKQVFGRNFKNMEFFQKDTPATTNPNEIKDADVYLIAVSDHAIAQVSELLKDKIGIVAHTSGSMSIDVIEHEQRAVFYPLQTFTKNKEIDFSNIPICLEAHREKDLKVLKKLAKNISMSVHQISSKERFALHRAAVFANNFSNHLYQIAEQICDENHVPFDLLKPLIMETADKIRFLKPYEAQTGPARRNDIETMQNHLDTIKNPIQKKIYQLLSESIKRTYEKEL